MTKTIYDKTEQDVLNEKLIQVSKKGSLIDCMTLCGDGADPFYRNGIAFTMAAKLGKENIVEFFISAYPEILMYAPRAYYHASQHNHLGVQIALSPEITKITNRR